VKLITRNTDYALRAICYISKINDLVAVAELVNKLGVPKPFMRKILQRMTKEKILGSYKGQGGGFRLKRGADRIYITDIMRIFQGPLELNGCFLKKDACPNKGKCVLRKKIRFIEEQALRELKKITISSLIEG